MKRILQHSSILNTHFAHLYKDTQMYKYYIQKLQSLDFIELMNVTTLVVIWKTSGQNIDTYRAISRLQICIRVHKDIDRRVLS